MILIGLTPAAYCSHTSAKSTLKSARNSVRNVLAQLYGYFDDWSNRLITQARVGSNPTSRPLTQPSTFHSKINIPNYLVYFMETA